MTQVRLILQVISTESLLAIDGILTFFCLSRILLGVFLSKKRRDEWQTWPSSWIHHSNIWGFPKIVVPIKMDGEHNENPYCLMDGFGGECSPPFKEVHIHQPIYHSNYPAKHTKINGSTHNRWTFQEHFHREERTVMPTAPARRSVLQKKQAGCRYDGDNSR